MAKWPFLWICLDSTVGVLLQTEILGLAVGQWPIRGFIFLARHDQLRKRDNGRLGVVGKLFR